MTLDPVAQLVVDHLGLVDHAAKQIVAGCPRHVDRDDLWSAGALGLVEAARRYRPEAGVPFGRYAAMRVRGAIVDSMRDDDWASRGARRRLRELREAQSHLDSERGSVAGETEVANRLGVTRDEVRARRMEETALAILHLDQAADGDTPIAATIEERNACHLPEESLCDRERIGALRTAISFLPPQQREVIVRAFFQDEPMRDIAVSLGVSPARVSQICAEAMGAIRAFLGAVGEALPEPVSGPGKRGRDAYLGELAVRSTWRSRLDAACPRVAGVAV